MRLLLFLFAHVLVTAGSAIDPAARWRWPVPLDPAVSSNFCEYRDGRFHAGIDVRTFGQEGVPCLAVADGWISRVRASSRGYGKALHLMLADSTQIVYAHLSEFSPGLEDTLLATQMKDTAYAVDMRVPRGRFRVQAGDTIAFSGSTGTPAPHLHLEVRDARDRPINPFGTDLAMPDRLRPHVSRVVFVPLSASARVNGKCLPWGATPRRQSNGRYVIEDTLNIKGRVGVAVAVDDRVNTESGRLAPQALEVHAGDRLCARIELARFSFDQSGEVDHLYHAGLLRARSATLFQVWDTGESPFEPTWVDGGVLPQDSSRVQSGRVRALDAAGNAAHVDFLFRCGTAAFDPREDARARQDMTVELEGAFFHDGFASIPLRAAERANPGAGAETLLLEAPHLGDAVQPLAAYADRDTSALWVAGLIAGEDRTLRLPAHALRVVIPGAAVRSDAVLYIRGVDKAGRSVDGLTRLTRPVRIGSVGWVLHAPMTVHIEMESPEDGQAIYRYDDYRRSWSQLASRRDETGWSAPSDRPGVFAVFRDDDKPRIGRPSLSRVRSRATDRIRREIRFSVGDAGSGFDEARTQVRVGGVRHMYHWDFTARKLVVPLHDASIIGKQSFHVVAFDRSGNRSTLSATVNTGEP
jgi:hypothetical protein